MRVKKEQKKITERTERNSSKIHPRRMKTTKSILESDSDEKPPKKKKCKVSEDEDESEDDDDEDDSDSDSADEDDEEETEDEEQGKPHLKKQSILHSDSEEENIKTNKSLDVPKLHKPDINNFKSPKASLESVNDDTASSKESSFHQRSVITSVGLVKEDSLSSKIPELPNNQRSGHEMYIHSEEKLPYPPGSQQRNEENLSTAKDLQNVEQEQILPNPDHPEEREFRQASDNPRPPGYRYQQNPENRTYGDPYTECITPLEEYSSRPSPLKPSLVETYPHSSSPSKLTPLDSYSQSSSPSGLMPLDLYTRSRAFEKQPAYPQQPTPPHSQPVGHSPASNSNREYGPGYIPGERYRPQGSVSYSQGPYHPQNYSRTSHHSPPPSSSPYPPQQGSPSVSGQPSPASQGMYRTFIGPYPSHSPDYYNNQGYYSPHGEHNGPPPAYPPNYPIPPQQGAPYPYYNHPGQQSNGGFMIDSILRSRNPETEDDDLTGVTDIVSYITQE